MKNKYKVVNVYTGYAEFGIENVDNFESAKTLKEFTKEKGEELVDVIVEEGSYGDKEHVEEFFGHSDVEGSLGMVQYGEENVLLIIPEGHSMYSFIKGVHGEYDYTDEENNKWTEYMNNLF